MVSNPNSFSNSLRNRSGFTLLEMVMVLAILAMLGALGVAVLPTAMENNRKDRAAGDLIVIQQGLEAYRAKFGDYPRYPASIPGEVVNETGYLLSALNGRYGPGHDEIDVAPMLNNGLLVFQNSNLPYEDPENNRILDPWENPYLYDDEPKNALGQKLFGYFLYSIGPDEVDGSADDIYAK